jgi:Na+-transporting NADH:ubiquinone oxidoreductase subunit NqrB
MTDMDGHIVPRGSRPPIQYPLPSRTEARRRVPWAAISIIGFIFILATLVGAAYIRLGDWPLGIIAFMMGVLIAVLVWMISRRWISS